MKNCLYICYNCKACDRLVSYIKEKNVKCRVVNVSEKKINEPNLSIFPALYVNGNLRAYGDDILNYL